MGKNTAFAVALVLFLLHLTPLHAQTISGDDVEIYSAVLQQLPTEVYATDLSTHDPVQGLSTLASSTSTPVAQLMRSRTLSVSYPNRSEYNVSATELEPGAA